MAECPYCKKQFEPAREWQVYCSPYCRIESHKARAQLARDVLKAAEEGRSLAVGSEASR